MTLQKDWTKTQLRLPPDLHPLVKQYAKDNDLSMNTAIVELLKQALKPPTQTIAPVGIAPQTPIKNSKRYIFTEWNYLEYDDDRLAHNEKARMACSDYMTRFFKDYPEHELIKFEFINEKDSKDREIIRGIRIWYTY